MNVRITPALGYAHGHIETLLIAMGVNVPARRPDGIVELELTEAQINQFQLRGNAHRVERIAAASEPPAAEPAPVAPAPAPAAAPPAESPYVTIECPACGKDVNIIKAMVPDGNVELDCQACHAKLIVAGFKAVSAIIPVPTLEEVKNAGYGEDAAAHIVARQTKLADWLKAGNSAKTFEE